MSSAPFIALGIVINASSILILYLLVYSLFYRYRIIANDIDSVDEYMYSNEIVLKNLVRRVNANDRYLKRRINNLD